MRLGRTLGPRSSRRNPRAASRRVSPRRQRVRGICRVARSAARTPRVDRLRVGETPRPNPLAGLFAHEFEHPGRTASSRGRPGRNAPAWPLSRRSNRRMTASRVFVDEHGRHAVKRAGDGCAIGEQACSRDALVRARPLLAARVQPQRPASSARAGSAVSDRVVMSAARASWRTRRSSKTSTRVRRRGAVALFTRDRHAARLALRPVFSNAAGCRRRSVPTQDDSVFNKFSKSQLPPTIELALTDMTQEILRRATS